MGSLREREKLSAGYSAACSSDSSGGRRSLEDRSYTSRPAQRRLTYSALTTVTARSCGSYDALMAETTVMALSRHSRRALTAVMELSGGVGRRHHHGSWPDTVSVSPRSLSGE